MDDDLVTTATAAEMLGTSVATVNRWAAERERLKPAVEFPGARGARLFYRSDILALLEDGAA